MRKILLLLLVAATSTLSFAEQASELPKGMLRLTQTTSFAFAVSKFNPDGQKVAIPKNDGRLMLLNLGAALELGIEDWVSALVEWVPGWNVWSDFDYQTAPEDRLTVNGGYDLFVATYVRILGPGGLLPSRRFRLAFAPGGVIPMASPDWQEQADRRDAGKHWRESANDLHTPALGSRGYFDILFSERFNLEQYAEFIRYFPKAYEEVDLEKFEEPSPKPDEVDYLYTLTLAVEPRFEFDLGGVRLGAGLPLACQRTPGAYLLAVGPNLTLFLPRPALELTLTYGYPILGKGLDAPALNSLSLQVRSYLRAFR